jgi:hypothetical protein
MTARQLKIIVHHSHLNLWAGLFKLAGPPWLANCGKALSRELFQNNLRIVNTLIFTVFLSTLFYGCSDAGNNRLRLF